MFCSIKIWKVYIYHSVRSILFLSTPSRRDRAAGITAEMKEEKEKQEKTGWKGGERQKKGSGIYPVPRFSALQASSDLGAQGGSPRGHWGINSGGKAYPASGEPVATHRQDNRVPGAPGMLSLEPPTRILLSPPCPLST